MIHTGAKGFFPLQLSAENRKVKTLPVMRKKTVKKLLI